MKLEAKGGFQATKKQPKYAPVITINSTSYSFLDHSYRERLTVLMANIINPRRKA